MPARRTPSKPTRGRTCAGWSTERLKHSDCGRYEPARVRAPQGIPRARNSLYDRAGACRREPGVGDSLALLLRIPECCNKPPNLERHGNLAGARMAATRSLGHIAKQPPARRDRRLSQGFEQPRAAAAGAWCGRTRCPDRRALSGARY